MNTNKTLDEIRAAEQELNDAANNSLIDYLTDSLNEIATALGVEYDDSTDFEEKTDAILARIARMTDAKIIRLAMEFYQTVGASDISAAYAHRALLRANLPTNADAIKLFRQVVGGEF